MRDAGFLLEKGDTADVLLRLLFVGHVCGGFAAGSCWI
jgi:hypothetical protein